MVIPQNNLGQLPTLQLNLAQGWLSLAELSPSLLLFTFHFCFLRFAFCFLLFTFYFLLFTFFFFLLTSYFLLFTFYFFNSLYFTFCQAQPQLKLWLSWLYHQLIQPASHPPIHPTTTHPEKYEIATLEESVLKISCYST